MKIYYDTVEEANGSTTGRMKGNNINLMDMIAMGPFLGKCFSVAINREGENKYSKAEILAFMNTTFVTAMDHLMNEMKIDEFTPEEKYQAEMLSQEMLESIQKREFDLTPWE